MSAVAAAGLCALGFGAVWAWATVGAATAVTLFFKASDAAVFAVRLYQKFAPEDVRRACLFEPTCSEYMIIAIKKYGFLKGVKKGIGRLRRCKFPNGGVDFP